MRKVLLISALFLAFSAMGCGEDNNVTGEDFGDIAAGTGGIVMTQAEHPVGWGKADCLMCHNNGNIHQTDRTGTGLNLPAIQALIEMDGNDSCAACHGTNGL